MEIRIQPKVGRPPKRAEPGTEVTLTMKLPAEVKNLIIDMAEAFDMSITEYLTSLVNRDAA